MDTIFDILGAAQGLVLTLVFIGIFACIIKIGFILADSRGQVERLIEAEPGTYRSDYWLED